MFRKLLSFLLLLSLSGGLYLSTSTVQAHADDTEKVQIQVLERSDCKHCQDEKKFLDMLLKTREDIEVVYFDLDVKENKELWIKVAETENIPKVTPITLIGDKVIQGFDKPQTTGRMFDAAIARAKGKKQLTFQELIDMGGSGNVEQVENGGCDEDSETCAADYSYEPFYVSIPLFGSIDVKQYSLPTMSLVLGFIDGFNPCAMWVLVTFLIVLIQVGDRRKMWQIAGLFILAEAIMYYLILNVWMTVWDFVGLDNIITPIVGVVAIGGGLFFLYEWKTADGMCKVIDHKKRASTRARISALAEAEMTIATIIGVLALALSVNIIEFACSIGIPQAFTKIIDMNVDAVLMKHLYMFLYILMYMVDDVIVFGIALYSFEKIGITTKYSKWCNLIGGLLMLILGALLIFAPDVLVL